MAGRFPGLTREISFAGFAEKPSHIFRIGFSKEEAFPDNESFFGLEFKLETQFK